MSDNTPADGAPSEHSGGLFADEYGPTLSPGDALGRYVVRERIGQGGFGVVYRAEQTEPVKREVALKVIKRGMDTDAVVARFTAERQALAMMQHRGIATIYESGVTQDGRPYFAMELVRGQSITNYCDAHKLTIEERLRVFVQVCDAVQHAHTKGVIHRDLKPNNILVCENSKHPVVKIIDFGVAKALHEKLTEQTLHTHAGQIIGTPEFMSPEQSAHDPQAVDTRTDVYSLGMVLYVLLTGSMPFERDRFQGATLEQIRQIIREAPPTRPSTRVSTRRAQDGTLEAERSIDRATLVKLLKRDLDWIVVKCLEKSQERRYESASALRADIDRYLAHEPVLASPPSTTYKLRKFYRRNRVSVSAAGLVLVALVGGLAGTTYGLLEADRHRQLASDRAEIAELAQQRAQEAERDASERAQALELIATFQADQIGAVVPERMGLSLRDAIESSVQEEQQESLDVSLTPVNFTNVALETLRENYFSRSLTEINERFKEQPEIQARLLHSLATTARNLGLFDIAREPQVRALELNRSIYGEMNVETLRSLMGQAIQLRYDGEMEASLAMHREVVARRTDLLGPDHPATLSAHNNLGVILQTMGMFDAARTAYSTAAEGRLEVLGQDHEDTLEAQANLGGLERAAGNVDASESLLQGVYERALESLGETHPRTISVFISYGNTLREAGRYEEAASLLKRVVTLRSSIFGDQHTATLTALNAYGQTLQEMGRAQDAEPELRKSYESRLRIFGSDNPLTVDAMNNLANALKDIGRFEEARVMYEESVESSVRVLGPDHPATLTTMNNLGSIYRELGQLDLSEQYYIQAYEGRIRELGPTHPNSIASMNNIGTLLQSQDRFEDAKPYFIRAAEGFKALHGLNHPDTLTAINNVAHIHKRLGEYAEAEPHYMEAINAASSVFGPTHYRTAVIINNVGTFYRDIERYEDAERLGRQAIDVGTQALGTQHWLIGVFKWHLARTLASRRSLIEAEALGHDAYKTMLAALGPDHERTQLVKRFMPQLYDLWHTIEPDAGYDEQAVVWRGDIPLVDSDPPSDTESEEADSEQREP